jgi:hypothetical protein
MTHDNCRLSVRAVLLTVPVAGCFTTYPISLCSKKDSIMNRLTCAIILGLTLVTTIPSFSQLREYPDESLVGVKGVHVVVRYQAPNEGAYGLTQKDLQKAVEARLQADNVTLLDTNAWHKESGEPYLFVNVVGTQVEPGKKDNAVFVYSFSADLIQKVTLGRDPSFATDGATWSQGYFIVVPKDQLNNVTLQISDVAHDFAGSLHQANATVVGKK